MIEIRVYDDTAEAIENLAEKLDTTVAEVIDSLMQFADELE